MWDAIYNLIPNLGSLIQSALLGFLPDWVVYIIMAVLGIAVVLGFILTSVLLMVWIERKLVGHFQVRHGPMRVGPHGILQSVADAIKILTKEDIRPRLADRWPFNLAPVLIFIPPLLAFAVLPFAPGAIVSDLNVGVLYVLAITSVSVLAVFMAGWSSANKYAVLSAMRAVAIMLSYEIPIVLSILGVVMITGSLSTVAITEQQGWFFDGKVPFLVLQPLGFLVFFIASLAEINRAPMEIVEADSEIVAGFHTEYTGMKFAMFYLGEYTHTLVTAGLISILFLGGYKGPEFLPPYVWFVGKIFALFFVFVWLRATLPRLRIDQLLSFAWKGLLPLAVANIFLTGLVLLALKGLGLR